MSSKAKKAKIGKDDLKRLMKERTNVKTQTKKIDSPLAKYNNIGQLICVLCNTPVKSELLWNAHIHGRTHRENLESLKKKTITTGPEPPSSHGRSPAVKRKTTQDTDDSHEPGHKRNKDSQIHSKSKGLPSDFFDQNSSTTTKESKTSSLSLGEYDDSSGEDEAEPSPQTSAPSGSSLPPDFFDKDIASSSKEDTVEAVKPANMAEALPEGFFDDPKLDAKVRQVEYKDKMEEEWEMFQRAMKEENTVSEQIMEEDDEQKAEDKVIDEIDEQMHQWSKINKLAEKKEEIMKQTQEKQTDSDDSDLDEKEFEEFLDWRSKKAMK